MPFILLLKVHVQNALYPLASLLYQCLSTFQTIPMCLDIIFSNNQEIISSNFSLKSISLLSFLRTTLPCCLFKWWLLFVCVFSYCCCCFSLMVVNSGKGRENWFLWSLCDLQKLLFYHRFKKQLKQPISMMLRPS